MNYKDIKEKDGKTIEQNNLEKKHKYEIGSLVEYKPNGIRLFVHSHNRGCDGTPLYTLAYDMDPSIYETFSGFNEEFLTLIKENR